MSTIFISHSSKDNAIARELERRLAEQNHPSVFLDLDPEKGIVAGQSWERTLYLKLRSCRAVIVLCTDNYLTSQWCFAEIALARMEGKRVLALQVEPLKPDAKLPSILTEKQFIDLRTNTEEGYQRLWQGLKEMDLLGVSNEWDPKQSPYVGLSSYEEEQANIFFGRDDETRAGIELLDRGAPGLIVVLGASGSGKSSIVRAGIVPRLRKSKDRWLIVGPFRPLRDPFAELAAALEEAFRTYAPDEAGSAETRDLIRAVRSAGSKPGHGAEDASGEGELSDAPLNDERLPLLMKQLEELRQSPPSAGGSPLLKFLDWSMQDLERICSGKAPADNQNTQLATSAPLLEAADHLRRASGRKQPKVLLVIDQFEELLGHEDAGDDANRFLEVLRNAIEADRSPLKVLGTMRSSFLGLFQRNRALIGIDSETLSVGPMRVDGIRRAIDEPAKLGAIELESGLADRLLQDTETPDALPLLSFTMSVLWRDYREDGIIRVREYESLGGLQGAIAREADAVLELARKQGKQDDVRLAFLQMVRLTEEGTYARLPAAWDREEIRKVRPILEEFEERRLLVTRMEEGEERTVEVAHEALFRSWAPLKDWLDNHRSELLLKAQLRRDAQAWEENHNSSENLWHGSRLHQAADLIKKGESRTGGKDRSSEERFVRAALRRRLIKRGTMAGTTLFIMLALAGLSVWALLAKSEAKERTIIAEAVGGKNLLDTSPSEGMLTTIASADDARREFSSDKMPFEIRSGVIEALQLLRAGGVPHNAFLAHNGESVKSVAVSDDGLTIVTGGNDKKVRLWDKEGKPLGNPLEGHTEIVRSVAVSGDGQTIVSAGFDGVRIWEQDGTHPKLITGQGDFLSADISSDGETILTYDRPRVRLWKRNGDFIREWKWGDAVAEAEYPIVLSRDGQNVAGAGAGGEVRLWDHQGKPIMTASQDDEEISCLAISADGQTIAGGGIRGKIRLWDRQGRLISQKAESGHDGMIKDVAVSSDAKTIISGGADGRVRIWDSAGIPVGRPLRGHDGSINSVAVTSDGNNIASVGEKMRLWERPTAEQPYKGFDGPVVSAAFSSDGRTILASGAGGQIRRWETVGESAEQDPNGKPAPAADSVSVSAWSPDGEVLVIGRADGELLLRNQQGAGGDKSFSEYHTAPVTAVAVSNGGKIIVSGDENGTVRIWNGDGKPVGQPTKAHDDRVASVALSFDGQVIVSGGGDGKIFRWNQQGLIDSKPLNTSYATGTGETVAVSPDGQTIVTGSEEGMLRWFDRQGKFLYSYGGHEQNICCLAFSAEGKMIASGADDGMVRLWSLEGKPIGQPFKDPRPITAVALSADENTLVTGDKEGYVMVRQIGIESFLREACDWLRYFNALTPPQTELEKRVANVAAYFAS